jgi:hypothetical protein
MDNIHRILANVETTIWLVDKSLYTAIFKFMAY